MGNQNWGGEADILHRLFCGFNMSQWLTVEQAADKIRRSPHTIYNWIYKTRRGLAKTPLVLRQEPFQGPSCKAERWLIDETSLQVADAASPRARHYASKNKKGIRYDGNDTPAKVLADRKKWIRDWIAEGKTVRTVLKVFDVSLHSEIEWLYWQSLEEAEAEAPVV